MANWAEFEQIFDARNSDRAADRPHGGRSPDDTRHAGDGTPRCRPISTPRTTTHRGGRTRALHLAIAEATHNPILVAMSVDLRARITLNLGAEPYTDEARRIAIGQHQELVAAVSEGRGDAAADIAARHFTLSENLIRKLVERAEHEDDKAERRMSRQLVFVLRRLLLTIPTLFVMSVVVFLIIRLVPGDPVRTMLGFRATDANVAEMRHQLGLDQSLFNQYLNWAGALLHGDLGKDIVSHAPLSELLAQRLPVTFELTALSMLLAVFVGVPLGVRAATGGRWVQAADRGLRRVRHQRTRFLARHHAGAGVRRARWCSCRRRATRPSRPIRWAICATWSCRC